MRQNRTPYWDDLIFSINSEQLSTKHHPLPWMRFLKVTIQEHTTGNNAEIDNYPCRYGHSPSIKELLTYLLEKSQLYANALDSHKPAHLYMKDKFRLKDCGQGLKVYLHTRDCFKSLCTLLAGTGLDIETLRIVLGLMD